MTVTSSDVRASTTEAAAMSGDLVQGLSSVAARRWVRELRWREVGSRLPGCTERLTTPEYRKSTLQCHNFMYSIVSIISCISLCKIL